MRCASASLRENADDLAESNTLSVGLGTVANPAVKALWLSPRLFTPNGDGVNDVLQIEYDLVNLSGAVPVAIDLYDLAGVKRCEVAHSTAASGRFSATWEGVDDAGNLLAPGLYLLRLEVDSDKARDVEGRCRPADLLMDVPQFTVEMLHFTPIYYPVSSELQDVDLRNISYLLKNDRFASNQGILETSLRGEHQEIRPASWVFPSSRFHRCNLL